MSVPTLPIFQVAFGNGFWWSIPAGISQELYQKYQNNENAVYTWDSGASDADSWQPEGELTSLNHYMIDFQTMTQRNLGNNRLRDVRLVFVATEKVDPIWTGQITQ